MGRLERVRQEAALPPSPTEPRSKALLWVWLGLALGLPVIAVSFRVAVAEPTSQAYFHLFWLGTLVAILPAVILVVARDTERRTRQLALLAVGAVLTTPVLLLRTGGPYYHDEFPHLREIQAILETGHLFQPVSIVPIAASFPGLHGLAAAVAFLGGDDAWTAGLVVVLIAHLLSMLGVYLLGTHFSSSERVGAVAALFYVLNPSYLFFDSQLAYESLGVCFFVWSLVLAVGITGRSPWRRTLLACVLTFACVATHHLTSLALLAVLLLLTLTRGVGAVRRRSAGAFVGTAVLTVATLAWATFWVVKVAPATYTYLKPYPQAAVAELYKIANRSGAPRTLYAGTTTPAYERWCAFATPVLVALSAAGGSLYAIRNRTVDATKAALYAFGMLYFAAVPLILTASGAEGARRSWAFSYLGLAVLVAPWLVHVLDRPGSRHGHGLRELAVVAVVVVLLVGNVSAGLNVYYRFPGPVTYGVETRSNTAETLAVAGWLRETAGPGARVVSDRITGLALGSTGAARLAVASQGFPVWELYSSTGTPPAPLVEQLRSSAYQYLVVDKRLAVSPVQGAYFGVGEPTWPKLPPFTTAQLDKFDAWAWTPKVYESRNYAVYAFDFSQLPSAAPPHLPEQPANAAKGRPS